MNEIPDIFNHAGQMIILLISTSVGSQWLQKNVLSGQQDNKAWGIYSLVCDFVFPSSFLGEQLIF